MRHKSGIYASSQESSHASYVLGSWAKLAPISPRSCVKCACQPRNRERFAIFGTWPFSQPHKQVNPSKAQSEKSKIGLWLEVPAFRQFWLPPQVGHWFHACQRCWFHRSQFRHWEYAGHSNSYYLSKEMTRKAQSHSSRQGIRPLALCPIPPTESAFRCLFAATPASAHSRQKSVQQSIRKVLA